MTPKEELIKRLLAAIHDFEEHTGVEVYNIKCIRLHDGYIGEDNSFANTLELECK